MAIKYFKIKRFDSFIIVAEDASEQEVRNFFSNNLDELQSSTETTLGYNDENETYFIYEWKTYDLMASDEQPFNEFDNFYKGKRNKLNNTATLKLENFVGVIKFRENIFEVHSEKLAYEKVHALVNYVDEKTTKLSLLFNSNAISKNSFSKGKSLEDDFNNFIFIYQLLKSNKLINMVKLILKNPFQHFQNTFEMIDISKVTNFSTENTIDVFSGQSHLVKSSKKLRITEPLNGYMPYKINQYENSLSVDNNENQFVLFFLKQCRKILIKFTQKFENHENNEKIINNEFILELKGYISQLSRIINNHFFREVGQLNVLNRSSMVLTRRVGYKSLYNFYLNMKSGPRQCLNENEFIELFENKSIDKLYEYLALFYLDDYIKEIYGIDPHEEKLSISKRNYTIILDERNDKIKFKYVKEGKPTVTLSFQRSYTRAQDTSYALNQNPDFSLIIENNNESSLYHFDTKFKAKYSVVSGNESMSQRNYAKEEDLKSMHAYRDGIFGTVGAYVLYPGNSLSKKIIYSDSRDVDEYAENFNPNSGIGSLPLQIEEENSIVKDFLNELIVYHSTH